MSLLYAETFNLVPDIHLLQLQTRTSTYQNKFMTCIDSKNRDSSPIKSSQHDMRWVQKSRCYSKYQTGSGASQSRLKHCCIIFKKKSSPKWSNQEHSLKIQYPQRMKSSNLLFQIDLETLHLWSFKVWFPLVHAWKLDPEKEPFDQSNHDQKMGHWSLSLCLLLCCSSWNIFSHYLLPNLHRNQNWVRSGHQLLFQTNDWYPVEALWFKSWLHDQNFRCNPVFVWHFSRF